MIKAIVNWLLPTNVQEYKRFLRFVGYNRRFLKGFLDITTAMTKLSQKDERFIWTDKCEDCFHKLNNRFVMTRVLTIVKGVYGFLIYGDASLKGLGCVLMQYRKVMAYTFHQQMNYKQNYLNYYLELVAIFFFALNIWRHYLYKFHCEIFSDHKELKIFLP